MSKYREVLSDRYGDSVNSDYATETMYDFMLDAPEEYENEEEMLEYLEKNPDCTLRDVFDYFNVITPDGLSPNDDGGDLAD